MCTKTCTQCLYFKPEEDWDTCIAPVPQWVELYGQTRYVNPHDDASDCLCFVDAECAP